MYKRLFIAIKYSLSNEIAVKLKQLQYKINELALIKWVDTDNLHLTVQFLGETQVRLISDIQLVLSKSLTDQKPFSLEINNLGTFDRNNNVSVIWLGLKHSDILNVMHDKLYKNLTSLFRDKKVTNEQLIKNTTFSPHITLGRIKDVRNPIELKKTIQAYQKGFYDLWSVNCVILFESKLTKNGALYNSIYKHLLT